MERKRLGYEDAPIIPGTRFRVHDGTRPRPGVARPGTASTSEHPGEPPSEAVILSDGVDLSPWASVTGGEAHWRVAHEYVEVIPGATWPRKARGTPGRLASGFRPDGGLPVGDSN